MLHALVVPTILETKQVTTVDLRKVVLGNLVASGAIGEFLIRAHRRRLPPQRQQQRRDAGCSCSTAKTEQSQ